MSPSWKTFQHRQSTCSSERGGRAKSPVKKRRRSDTPRYFRGSPITGRRPFCCSSWGVEQGFGEGVEGEEFVDKLLIVSMLTIHSCPPRIQTDSGRFCTA